MMNINDEVTKYQKGERNYTPDQIVILNVYMQMLFDISSKNIMKVTDHMEKAFNACK